MYSLHDILTRTVCKNMPASVTSVEVSFHCTNKRSCRMIIPDIFCDVPHDCAGETLLCFVEWLSKEENK